MVVIGGRNSGNTKRLYEICKGKVNTYWITDPSELDKKWFSDARVAGITAGASTPKEIVDRVSETISAF